MQKLPDVFLLRRLPPHLPPLPPPPHLPLLTPPPTPPTTLLKPPQELARRVAEAPPPDPDAATRRDLTHLTVYTIDDESTTEIDDGLSVEE